MANRLRQIKVNCPHCGEFLFKVYRIILQLNDKTKAVAYEEDPDYICQKCHPRDFYAILKNAEKIEMLTVKKEGTLIEEKPE